MSLYGDRDAATAADPQAPQTELARLAWERPDLRPVIAMNPQAYPDLLGWLASQNDPATTAALRQRAAQTVAAMPPVPAAPVQPSSPAPQADLFTPPGSAGQAPVPAQPDLFSRPVAGGQPGYTARSFDLQPTPGYGPAETSFAPAPAKRSRRPLLVGIGAAVTVVIAASSVFAYTQVFSKVGGSSSPEAAASQLLHAVADRDLVGIGGAIAPSEVTPFKDLSSQLEDVASAASGSSSNPSEEVTSSVMDLLDAFDVKLSDLKLDATTVDDGLARVEITSGTLTIDADPATLSDAAVTFLQDLEQQVAEQSGGELSGSAQDYSSLLGDPESSRAQVEGWAAASLPFTFSISDIPPGSFTPLLMAVEEDGAWYVSPLMTIGEYAVMSAGVARGAMPTGDQIANYSTPEKAASGMVEAVADAVSTGTITQLVASLPQMERRFAAVYLVPLLGSEQATSETTLTVTDSTFTVAAAGNNRALLVPDSVTLEYADSSSQGSMHLSGYCGTVTTDGETSSGCLTDQPIATEFGVDTMSIVAVQEDDRWFVSPSATLVDMTRILATNLQRLQQEGKLDDPAWLEQQLGVDGSSGLEGLLGSSLLGPSLLGYGYGYEDSGF